MRIHTRVCKKANCGWFIEKERKCMIADGNALLLPIFRPDVKVDIHEVPKDCPFKTEMGVVQRAK
jgi:hypothetical protein